VLAAAAAAAAGAAGADSPAPAAAAAAASAAAGTPDSDEGGFTTTLHDMSQLYHHLSRFLGGTQQLPAAGFSVLQDPQRMGQLQESVLVRLKVSKAFNDTPLIWLPDTDKVLKAAAAYKAAESQRAYMDEDAYSMGSMGGPGGPGGYGSSRNVSSSSSRRGGRTGRGPGKALGRGPAASAAAQAATAAAAAATAEPVADDVMYDGALIGSLARTPMRGRFYTPDQLRFNDDAKVFEVTYPVLHKHFGSASSSSSQAAGAVGVDARPPPMLRVLGVYYAAQRDLFVQQLQRFKYSSWIPLCGKCGLGEATVLSALTAGRTRRSFCLGLGWALANAVCSHILLSHD
jgi:hypothetical protein